jgi:YidC/Oxa1 family membrane protein insertase
VFPLGVVVGGPFLPLAILVYWVSNNIWTFGQQHYVFGMIEKEEEAKKQEVIQRRAANAPAPGAKPKRQPKTAPGDAGSDGQVAEAETAETEANKPTTARNHDPTNHTPRPGARPKKRKR